MTQCVSRTTSPKDGYPPIAVDCKFAASMNEKVGEPVDWEAPAAAGGAASGGATSVAAGNAASSRRTCCSRQQRQRRRRRRMRRPAAQAAAAAAAAAARRPRSCVAPRLIRMQQRLIDPQLIASVKQATVRIALLNVSTKRMINVGSGVIVDAGPGASTNQVLTAAHNFIDPNENLYWPGTSTVSGANPRYLKPYWTPGLPEDIDWASDAAKVIIAVGIYEADGGPSKWAYWAELVTPLATLQELRPSPHDPPGSPPTQLLDLAVIRIRGRLELDPPTYSGMSTDYSLKKKHAASLVNGHAVLNPPLPDGLPLRDLNAEPLTVNVDMVNSFGWPSPDGETTLHADGAKPVQALALGLMMSNCLPRGDRADRRSIGSAASSVSSRSRSPDHATDQPVQVVRAPDERASPGAWPPP